MEVCERYGIPHSEFLKWSKDDRDKALALHLRKRSTCKHCGTRPEEWDERRGGSRNAYVPDIDRCRGCEQMQAYDASLSPEDRKELGRGIYIVLRRRREV
ncbi:hypothetical protein FLW53_09635 [Microbispora sp. SCL1-1]|uniref:hypothetical protein n=1 Tax=unclassified Microbispora TaxID=2614687 RepID=UPI001157FF17|nr:MULTISPECIES: hypothetical protein [unclassified Microbispora]NJP24465.1 hypothetical protein [Microbispora sp. CL1-1]TQS14611.1 hypothetical protein FLW53_09635 [Microbispora sp. SCL1-1]